MAIKFKELLEEMDKKKEKEREEIDYEKLCDEVKRNRTPEEKKLYYGYPRYKDVVMESSLSRVFTHIADPNRSFGMVYPYRHDMEPKERGEVWKKLIKDIRKLNLGYIECKGGYTETTDDGKKIFVDEDSFLIPKISKKAIIKLGVDYEQESIIYKDKHEFSMIATNEKTGVGKVLQTFDPSKGVSIETAKKIFSDFYTRLKKGSHRNKKFLFTEFKEREYIGAMRKFFMKNEVIYIDMFEGFEDFHQ